MVFPGKGVPETGFGKRDFPGCGTEVTGCKRRDENKKIYFIVLELFLQEKGAPADICFLHETASRQKII